MKATWRVRRNVRENFPEMTPLSRILKDKQTLRRWTRERGFDRCQGVKARKVMVSPENSKSGRQGYEMAGGEAGRSVKDQFTK